MPLYCIFSPTKDEESKEIEEKKQRLLRGKEGLNEFMREIVWNEQLFINLSSEKAGEDEVKLGAILLFPSEKMCRELNLLSYFLDNKLDNTKGIIFYFYEEKGNFGNEGMYVYYEFKTGKISLIRGDFSNKYLDLLKYDDLITNIPHKYDDKLFVKYVFLLKEKIEYNNFYNEKLRFFLENIKKLDSDRDKYLVILEDKYGDCFYQIIRLPSQKDEIWIKENKTDGI